MVAPTLVDAPDHVVRALERKLTDPSSTLAAKYRVLFSLRNIRGEAAHRALMIALADPSCLFRHDVAFCLGQRQDPASVAALSALLRDSQREQHAMVRHEAAEALGAIAGADGESGGAGGAGEDEGVAAAAAAAAATATAKEEQEGEEGEGAGAAAPSLPSGLPKKDEVEASCRALLREHLQDACEEVRETCELALARIEHVERERERRRRERSNNNGDDKGAAATTAATTAAPSFEESPYLSVDPTPALPSTTPLPELEALLMDPSKPMFERYQALFAVRNRGGDDGVRVLCAALRGCSSALLKHEVAYVLGQMQSPASVLALLESLADAREHPMVRHEAAEALGAVATASNAAEGARAALEAFSRDPEPIVAESCAVALDVAEHGDEFEYADLGQEGEGAGGCDGDAP